MLACANSFAERAKVAELVDAQDLGSCGATRESSSLSFRTIFTIGRLAVEATVLDWEALK